MGKIKETFTRELPFFFICPALIWQILFLYIPLVILLVYSFTSYLPGVGSTVFSLQNYKKVLQPASLGVLFNSFLLAFETMAICFLIAYPLAFFLTFKVQRFRTVCLLLVILPSWTSFIVQIYAWFFLLKKGGLVSQLLCYLRILPEQAHILNNHPAMLICMVYCYLPFMVLPIYAVLEKIDRRLLEASSDLGASRWLTIQKVIFPLSMRGVLTGLFLVFVPAFGEFAIPEFIGGSKKLFWGNVIVSKFLDYRDWHSGAAATYSAVIFPALAIGFLFLIIKLLKKVLSHSWERGR